MKTVVAAIFALAWLLGAGGAHARITEIRIDAVEPFIDGHSFGTVGPYERLKGIAKGELDPNARENAGIVDLDKAPRNSRGMVEYEVDIFILRPADPAKGSGILYYEVLNRGNKQLGTRLLDVTSGGAVSLANALNNPTTPAHVGNAFVFERGYTVVWSAWDPDVSSANARMTARFPVAMENGAPMVRRIREEFQVGKRVPADVEVARLNYPAASTDRAKAQLFVRDRHADQRTEVPADQWEFASPNSVRLLPKGTKFTTAAIYELYYEATQSKVVGIGFAATRDVVSFLRHEKADDKGTANPLNAHGIRHALAFGGSQAGRFLRHYVELGMNKDLAGRKVFDGVFSHTAGAGKVFANHSFAEPDRTVTQHEDHDYPENWFPFSTAHTTDPLAGKTGSLLRGDGSDPLMIETNTSTEYWQKGASLLTTDPAGKSDLSLPANSRVYLIAGTQHGGRAGLGTRPGVCANPTNPHSPAPAMRALLVALEQWVTEGIAPPASRVPTIAADTAIDDETIKFPALKGVTLVRAGNRFGPLGDWIAPPRTGSVITWRAGNSTAPASPPWTATATRPPASGCRRSRCRSRPIPAGTSTRACRASCATATAATSRSQRPRPSVTRRTIRARRSRNATARAPTMSRR